jgi:hypothetical protein
MPLTSQISEYEKKMIVAKLKAARDRIKVHSGRGNVRDGPDGHFKK